MPQVIAYRITIICTTRFGLIDSPRAFAFWRDNVFLKSNEAEERLERSCCCQSRTLRLHRHRKLKLRLDGPARPPSLIEEFLLESAGRLHLPPWLLPGWGMGKRTETTPRTWKDKYETEDNLAIKEVSDPQGQQTLLEFADIILDPSEPHNCKRIGCRRVILNISGLRFETQLRTLNRFPGTLLGDPVKRSQFWDSRRNEFFLDRHRPSFQAILYFYQSGGRLRRPLEVPEDVFLEELEFYQLGEATIREYKEKEGFVVEKRRLLPKTVWQRRLWLFCEEPDSSWPAKVFAIASVACIVVSIINFCLETLPAFERDICLNTTIDQGKTYFLRPNYLDPFFIIESICVTWFTIEFSLRLLACPSKPIFARNIMNIFDLLAILPFFIILAIQQTEGNCEKAKKSGSFIFIRVLRVFRIFKLSKHSQGLRILGLTIKTSLRELGMFFFFLIIAMIIFSSAAYYAEAGQANSKMTSIPDSFWWAIVTMTTVGYGDIVPVGVWGKLVGTFCVIAGVLTIALPVPVVVANFNNFYRHESGRGYISA